jgi:hypothetical protein
LKNVFDGNPDRCISRVMEVGDMMWGKGDPGLALLLIGILAGIPVPASAAEYALPVKRPVILRASMEAGDVVVSTIPDAAISLNSRQTFAEGNQ